MIENLINEIAGNNALKLLKELLYRENVSEIELSEKLKISVNEVRSVIYKLHAYNLVNSTRKKDKEKGWYIYYWSFNFHHARDLLNIKKKKRFGKLKKALEEQNERNIYECKNNCIKVDLNEAMGYNFRCPDCEQLLIHKDNSKNIDFIKKELEGIKEELEILKQPIKVTIKKEEIENKIKKKVKKKSTKKKVVKKIKPKKKTKKIISKKKVVKKFKPKKKTKKIISKKKVVKKIKPKKKVVKKKFIIKQTPKKSFFGKLKRKIKF